MYSIHTWTMGPTFRALSTLHSYEGPKVLYDSISATFNTIIPTSQYEHACVPWARRYPHQKYFCPPSPKRGGLLALARSICLLASSSCSWERASIWRPGRSRCLMKMPLRCHQLCLGCSRLACTHLSCQSMKHQVLNSCTFLNDPTSLPRVQAPA